MTNSERLDFDLEIKQIDKETGTFTGYGSIFGNVDLDRDIMEKGAFKKSIRKRQPKLLWQHRRDMPIGIFTKVKEDDTGLLLEGKLALDTQQGREASELLSMGAISGMSIGGNTALSSFDTKRNIRIIKEFNLWEVSLVTFPANEEANVFNVKSATVRDFEKFLRDVGCFSQSEAKCIASHGFKAYENQRDVDLEGLEDSVESLIKSLTEYVKDV